MADPQEEISQVQGALQQLQFDLQSLKGKFSLHQHTGFDGSVWLDNTDILLRENRALGSGSSAVVNHNLRTPAGTVDSYQLFFDTGPDAGRNSPNVGNLTGNTQVEIEKNPGLFSFFFGINTGISVDCSNKTVVLTNGQTVFTDSDLVLNQIEYGSSGAPITGYYFWFSLETPVTVNGGPHSYFAYPISGFGQHSVTLASPIVLPASSDGKITDYVIANSVYLGGTLMPWKRVYTDIGAGGGLRFGVGDTNNGQNSLLYADASSGALLYRDFSGNVSSIGGGTKISYTAAGVQSITNVSAAVVFDTEIYDTNSEFAANSFTVTNAGYYHIEARLTMNTLPGGAGVNMYIVTASRLLALGFLEGDGVAYGPVVASCDVLLAAGDVVHVEAALNVPGAINTWPLDGYTNFYVHAI